MNNDHSSARPIHVYQPTIIENRFLISRLAIQIAFLKYELKRGWADFETDPAGFTTRSTWNLYSALNRFVSTPNALYACATAIMAVTCVVIAAFVVQSTSFPDPDVAEILNEPPVELVLLDVAPPPEPPGVGKTGGNSLSVSEKPFRGMSGGGNRDPLPPQFGKLPPPSLIPAAIPTTPPINPPTLPVAGIDIDPSLWKDVDARVYGDPNSKSEIPSSGPGDGGGIGTGIGPGSGGGTGPGGCGPRRISGSDVSTSGCIRDGNRSGSGPLTAAEVDQRARLLFKPEPQYTEEARRNQITGTVMLRVVFSNVGEVDQIRAVRTLPFGLTERAIAAARQIKFVPAIKDGHAVSVHMQLEYNFNLY